ncbi:GNAT family N-acetyltransferase [Methylobacterium gossipiicola]|uniref:Predicted N-acetyltransferase YhbS n=1 Tax=Methylobacterium gossipiicola TaxID=582675 RepID=A0A1I2WKG8_9HYPH|nr:N-acetyltransferase [Methylobacterium gossipiicola]SFH00846.1 Predicted N-acetyltransferase YhbS [Methylobacterium gossipiicola]
MTALPLILRTEHPGDAAGIERLHARAFGPGRFARTAYRLREGSAPVSELCFTALVGSYLVGSVRLWPAEAGGSLLVLGPLTVDPSFEGRGIGSSLMHTALDAARSAGHGLVVLVGDAPYYRRFGFTPVPPGRLVPPGPVDPARFLCCELVPGAAETVSGTVSAVRPR